MRTEVDELLAVLDAGFPPVSTLTPTEVRELVASRAQPVTNVDDVRSATDEVIEAEGRSVRVRVYQPRGDTDTERPVVVFFHGGGFVFCSIESHDGFCRSMSRNLEAVVVSVDYRLAPEAKAPAATQDAYLATRWVAQNAERLHIDPRRLLVAGDSAGGNLAAVVCLMARDLDGPEIAGQVLLYPVIEPVFDNEGHRRFGTGCYNTTDNMRWYWEQYLPAGELPVPVEHVVPSRASSHAGLPPTVVVTPGRDPLTTEGEQYVARLRADGVPVRHRHYPDLFHGFVSMAALAAGASARELLWHDVSTLIPTPVPDASPMTPQESL